MVSAGSSLSNDSVVSQFTSTVQTAAHNGIVFHSGNRHTRSGATAATSEYAGDNPGSGVSIAGVGANNTTVDASTVYDHLNAATYNLTHIRQSRASFYLNVNGSNVLQGTIGPSLTVRPTSKRQSVSGVSNGGVAAGSTASAGSINTLCTNMYNKWNALKNNRSDINVYYCHTSCHTSCHSSRGRR